MSLGKSKDKKLPDAERRGTWRDETTTQDFISSVYDTREESRHDAGKPTPSVATPSQNSIYSVHGAWEATRQDAGFSKPRVAMTIVAKPAQDSI
jgi:hypothetical protein